MSKLRPIYLVTCLLLAAVTLSSCEDSLVDLLIDDCNSYNYPVITTDALSDGKLDELYSDLVVAEVRNDPHDDQDYHYFFEVSGVLPEGIYWSTDNRRVYFEGTPRKSGLFRFTVEVWVEVNQEWWYTEEIPELCDDYDSKVFTIFIGD